MAAQDGRSTGAAVIDPERMIAEARKAFFVMFGFVVVVWAVQLANAADDYGLSREFAVTSREAGSLPHLLAAPFLHWNWAHIESNSGPLFVFGFLAAYRGVVRFLGLTLLVAATSGFAVWFFEQGGTATVGASGLIFGYFGYVVVRGLFDRHLIDTLIGLVMAASFAYLLTVAVPGTPGVSWLGHLGGLVGGLVGAWIFRDRRPATARAGTGRSAAGGGPPVGGGGRKKLLPGGRKDSGARPDEPAGATPSGDGSRADLHKELRDLGLLDP